MGEKRFQQILGNGIAVFCNKNLCTSEKEKQNTLLRVELSLYDGLKK